MGSQKCVVEGCNLEYDVVCSFSFYNANTTSPEEKVRQNWIEGAMQEESECLWRHVSLQLCGYHFELDTQGLWIDSPMLPELLTPQETPKEPSEEEKKLAELIKIEHNYNQEPPAVGQEAPVSRLNVRQLVDTLGYLSLKKLQQKQLWVVKVETDKAEASIAQSEQVITKMQDPKQIIEIIPQSLTASQSQEVQQTGDELQIMDESNIGDEFVCEIAEEQEITMEEEIPTTTKEWTVNIIPDVNKTKYAFVKHHHSGKKKRHFTSEMSEITLQQGDYDNYYILPDADPSVGVEITTTNYEPEYTIVEEFDEYVVEERPKKRGPKAGESAKKRKKKTTAQDEIREVKMEMGTDWVIENNIAYEEEGGEQEEAKRSAAARHRRKNNKYLGYDFVT